MSKIFKQVILIRRDLKMRRGKEIAQGSHAAMMFFANRVRTAESNLTAVDISETEQAWFRQGMAKICLKVTSEEELLRCHQQALEAGIASYLVRDSGKTEFGGVPTYTACAIGPEEISKIDGITRDLTLY